MNQYYLKARLFPTTLTVVPLLILVNNLTELYLHDTLSQINEILPWITDLGLSGALLFLMVQLNRLISKEVFQRIYFQEEIKMPTTNYLMWDNDFFTKSTKQTIYNKIQSRFNIRLLEEKEVESNEKKARKQIVIAVSQIRNLLRNNKLLLQHNIEYGFFRNLMGGCIFALIFSIGIFILGLVSGSNALIITSCVLVFIYLIPVLFSSLIIKRFGKYYSKVLYEQFLSD